MKYFVNILFLIGFWSCFSQGEFNKMPEKATEIHFVYEMKSNYIINDEGIFADTLLLQIDFPNFKYSLRKHPLDSTIVCGFSTFKGFGTNNRQKLKSIIYHTNETINAIHFVVSKKTVFNVVRGSEETEIIFKKHFKERFTNFEYRQEFDFVKRIEKRKYPRVNYDFPFDKITKSVEFTSDESIGFYYDFAREVLYKNIIFFNKDLSVFISPIVFENSRFGVEKIETISRTIILKSVYYK
ncbi:hypothetical protein [Flavobacterium sp.]|uniref:hypothetical protein n=1 Tax=Flavobacterium sp. TaxID=239 RepID=UPI0039192414